MIGLEKVKRVEDISLPYGLDKRFGHLKTSAHVFEGENLVWECDKKTVVRDVFTGTSVK